MCGEQSENSVWKQDRIWAFTRELAPFVFLLYLCNFSLKRVTHTHLIAYIAISFTTLYNH
jgi:hypothetical protein